MYSLLGFKNLGKLKAGNAKKKKVNMQGSNKKCINEKKKVQQGNYTSNATPNQNSRKGWERLHCGF